jgi:hypothetical protein
LPPLRERQLVQGRIAGGVLRRHRWLSVGALGTASAPLKSAALSEGLAVGNNEEGSTVPVLVRLLRRRKTDAGDQRHDVHSAAQAGAT